MISVIIPVYNVEKYLDKCIQSVLNQSDTNFEIILIDDGSTDSSPNICDEFVKGNSKIRVIHQSNRGVSYARNIGISLANGEYVLFLDSDDQIEEFAIKRFNDTLVDKHYDIIAGEAKRVSQDSKISYYGNNHVRKACTGIQFLKENFKVKDFSMIACVNLYNKTFLEKNNLAFTENILHEDEEFTPRVFLKAESVIYINSVFYIYCIRKNSITTIKDKTKNGLDLISICYKLDSIYKKIADEELKYYMQNYLITIFLNGFYVGKVYRKKYKKLIDNNIFKDKKLSKRNYYKSLLFKINKTLYYYTNAFYKLIMHILGYVKYKN